MAGASANVNRLLGNVILLAELMKDGAETVIVAPLSPDLGNRGMASTMHRIYANQPPQERKYRPTLYVATSKLLTHYRISA